MFQSPLPPSRTASLAVSLCCLLVGATSAEAQAPAETHWAYSRPRPVAPPAVDDTAWVAEDVDHFVLSRLEEAGLAPAPQADPRTLVRRLSFDLLGLPPSQAQVDAFRRNPSDAAWNALVEEMLASPHHAERLATHWFDLVRFADTIGIHGDNPWNIWPYRDWVIEAFHTNKPFDEFTIEQLAGDLLPDPTLSQQVAAAYNRLNLITREGGSQPKEFLIRYTADRVRNVSEVWMAASMGCCECHDHKFDPLSIREFYEFGAFFADIEQVGVYQSTGRTNFKPELQVPSVAESARKAELEAQRTVLEAAYAAETPALAEDQRRFEAELLDQGWRELTPVTARSEAGQDLQVLEDRSVLAAGDATDKDTYVLEFELPGTEPFAALRLEVLADDSLPNQGPGRAANGNFVLSEIRCELGDEKLPLTRGRASYEQPNYPLQKALDGKGGRPGWAVMRANDGAPAEAVFELESPRAPGSAAKLTVHLVQEHGGRHVVGRFRLSTAARTGLAAIGPDDREALEAPAETRSAELTKRLRELHRESTPILAETRAGLANTRKELQALDESIPLVLRTRSVKPMETRVRPRGNWMDDSGDVVMPGVPAAFGVPLASEGRATRLDLARWLVDPRHPTTARATVNRIWKLLFGRGIVRSLDDFGLQGAQPTDLALLDHLATRFVASGWDLRDLIRGVVRSRAYRQASWAPELPADDPERASRFGQQQRFRLDAEFVRDQALVASGLLDPTVGGPSVFPYQPPGYWKHLNFPRRKYQPSAGQDQYRRAVYAHWQRQYVHPSLMAYDAPSRERCIAERQRSNTPLAALAGLNDPSFVEAARVLAARTLREAASRDDLGKLTHMLGLVLQRTPTDREAQRLTALLQEHRSWFTDEPAQAEALLSVGSAPRDASQAVPELAAWTSVARVLLNLHETIQRT